MWIRTYSIVTKEVTREQMWKLFANVNNWHTWDEGTESAKLEGNFEIGNFFILKPKGGPKVKVELLATVENQMLIFGTKFPLAKMYDRRAFEETSEGVKFTSSIIVTGILGFIPRMIVARKIVENLPKDMQHQIKSAKNL